MIQPRVKSDLVDLARACPVHDGALDGVCTCPVTCRADGIWFAYRQDQWILQDVTLEVPPCSFLTVIGSSGSGKTTLVKVLAGLLQPQRGRVDLLGSDTCQRECARPEFRQQVGYIPQQLGLVRSSTALDNVMMGALGRTTGVRHLLGLYPAAEVDQAMQYLAALGIAHKAGESVFRMSGGERQRVAIARTLLQKPKVIFADEFVSDLDLPRAAQVLESMRDLCQREGIAFVINLHEIPLVQELGDQVIMLRGGNIVYRGAAASLNMQMVREVLA